MSIGAPERGMKRTVFSGRKNGTEEAENAKVRGFFSRSESGQRTFQGQREALDVGHRLGFGSAGKQHAVHPGVVATQ